MSRSAASTAGERPTSVPPGGCDAARDSDLRLGDASAAFVDRVLDESGDDPPRQLVRHPGSIESRIALAISSSSSPAKGAAYGRLRGRTGRPGGRRRCRARYRRCRRRSPPPAPRGSRMQARSSGAGGRKPRMAAGTPRGDSAAVGSPGGVEQRPVVLDQARQRCLTSG